MKLALMGMRRMLLALLIEPRSLWGLPSRDQEIAPTALSKTIYKEMI